jgi:protein-L-isoaspartate(D-aspartate) O-methyltransferase
MKISKGDKVLEIGTGSGYQACILLELGADVYTIEYNKKLFDTTKKFLPAMGYHPHFFHGDGTRGLITFSPYDKILVTAGAPSVPKELSDQLKTGGILVIPVGDNQVQQMIKITKKGENKFERESYNYFSFVPLLGEYGWKK